MESFKQTDNKLLIIHTFDVGLVWICFSCKRWQIGVLSKLKLVQKSKKGIILRPEQNKSYSLLRKYFKQSQLSR